MIQPLWKMVWRFLKKLEIKPPYDPAIPLLGMYLEETKIEKDTYPIVHCSTIYNTRTRKPEKATAPYSSTLAWKIPWMEEPGRL